MNFPNRPSAGVALGLELRAARRYRHLTQQRAAERAGVDLATLAGLEAGRGTVAPFLAILRVLEHRFVEQGNEVELGRWLAERRRSVGLSQQDLARQTGLSKPTIIQIERGRGHIDSLCAVMTALRVRAALRPEEPAFHQVSLDGITRTPLRYPGGKTRALKVLASHLPNEIDEFREPFVGGGSVALYISQQFPNATIWINDAYTPLTSFWTVLQDPARAPEMVERLRELKCKHPDETSARELFYRVGREMHDPASDDLTRAIGFYVANRCSFSGLTQSGSFSTQASRVRWTMGHIERLIEFTPLIARWRVTNLDYQEVLREPWSRSFPFTFLDLPYDIQEDRLYGRLGDTHRGFDHGSLRDLARELSSRVMITYNSSGVLRRLYANWQQVTFDLGYSMNSNRKYRFRQKSRRELLVRNYHVVSGARFGV
jgi:DNA adenine methylase Dam